MVWVILMYVQIMLMLAFLCMSVSLPEFLLFCKLLNILVVGNRNRTCKTSSST